MTSPPTIVLATSNGTGMGHLARQAATALALDGGDLAGEPVLFSLSQALPLVRTLGLRGEYCPGSQRRYFTSVMWHQYLADRIAALVEETSAKVFAFDGAFPYYGLSLARRRLPDVAFVWVRRGMWRPGANVGALRKRAMFDLVLEPGDLAAGADRGATAGRRDAVRVLPVTLLEQVRRLPREQARGKLGLDPDRPAALVTLRPSEAADAAVHAILERSGWQVALTRTPVGADERSEPAGRIVPLRGVFPLAAYLSAFDIAVTECGYNSFHEMLHGGVPAVFVPTDAAVTDDQPARARWAADQGLALTAGAGDPARVGRATGSLLDEPVREKLAARCAELPPPTGAATAAATLAELAREFSGHRFSLGERVEIARSAVRPAATKVAGRRGVATADRLLGRKPQAPPQPGPPRFVTAADDVASGPVEDVLLGTSEDYLRRRQEIAARYYPKAPL